MKNKKQTLNLKVILILSAILIIIFMLTYFLKNKESSSLGSIDSDNNSVKDSKNIKSKESKSIDTKRSDKKIVNSKSSSKNQKTKSTNSTKTIEFPKSKLTGIKTDKESVTQTDKKHPTNSKSKAVKSTIRPKTYKYSKRFLQIDQDLDNYSILKGVYYLPNTSNNRAKYSSGLIQDSFLKVSSKKNLNADTVLQNKVSKNFSLFKRVVKFQVKDEMGTKLLSDLKEFQFVDMNELSMVNSKYVLKFRSPEEAFKAYSLIKDKPYLKWSSIDVFEFVKISE